MAQLGVQQGQGQAPYSQPYIVDSLLQMDMKGVGSFYYENFVSMPPSYLQVIACETKQMIFTRLASTFTYLWIQTIQYVQKTWKL